MSRKIKKAKKLIKKLGLMAPNILTPEVLAHCFDEHVLANQYKHPGLYSVGGGEGYLGLSKTGKNRHPFRIAVIGKGITFDTGGVSIKGPHNMHEMKFDMLGAATTIALKDVLRNSPHDISLYAPIAENSFKSEYLMRPGDVLEYPTEGKPTKVEVINTDAEGRLILADAIIEAKKHNPDIIITIATLTGAAKAALGEATAVFSNDQELCDDFISASEITGELAWPMPIFEFHRENIKGKHGVADILNCGTVAGASTAAAFLEHFVGDVPWIHLDIAGSAYKDGVPTAAMLETLVEFINMFGDDDVSNI